MIENERCRVPLLLYKSGIFDTFVSNTLVSMLMRFGYETDEANNIRDHELAHCHACPRATFLLFAIFDKEWRWIATESRPLNKNITPLEYFDMAMAPGWESMSDVDKETAICNLGALSLQEMEMVMRREGWWKDNLLLDPQKGFE